MQTPQIDPAILTWAARITELSAALPDLRSTEPSARRLADRQLSDALAREFAAAPVAGVRITPETVKTGIGALRARRYLPAELAAPAPTEVFLHGGGFTSGTIDELINDALLSARALEAQIQVISLEYRLAPEHPYPAAVNDVVATLDALRENADDLGVDAARVGLAGASAGAAIAASAALRVRDRGDRFLVHQSLEVPAIALEPVGKSAVMYASGYGVDGYEMLADLYLADPSGVDENAQALFATDLSELPPTYIAVAEHDPLRDAGLMYAQRLREAGVPVVLDVGRGHVHGSPGLTAAFPAAQSWQQRSAAAARRAYRSSRDDIR